MYLTLNRLSDDGIQTLGKLTLSDSIGNPLLTFDTLELSYNNNERQVSCIPNGTYVVRRKTSFRFGQCFELLNVKNRSAILLHSGNFNSQTKGCILVGNGLRDINDDGLQDVLNSKISMSNLLHTLRTVTTISITSKWLGYELK